MGPGFESPKAHHKSFVLVVISAKARTKCGCGEMADALALGASVHDVGVQVPSSAPQKEQVQQVLAFFVV